jgi:hypothetical protein
MKRRQKKHTINKKKREGERVSALLYTSTKRVQFCLKKMSAILHEHSRQHFNHGDRGYMGALLEAGDAFNDRVNQLTPAPMPHLMLVISASSSYG